MFNNINKLTLNKLKHKMGKPTGFLEFTRELPDKRPVAGKSATITMNLLNDITDEKLNQQAARCMNCGVPFCHNGCPLGNVIPEFNDAVYQKELERSL